MKLEAKGLANAEEKPLTSAAAWPHIDPRSENSEQGDVTEVSFPFRCLWPSRGYLASQIRWPRAGLTSSS